MGKKFIQQSDILSLTRRAGPRDFITRTPRGWVYTLWNTDIAILDGSALTLNTGGYRTKLTRDRLNDVLSFVGLPYKIKQIDFDWYIVSDNGETAKFDDGITIAVL
jgi:hypothetical protein